MIFICPVCNSSQSNLIFELPNNPIYPYLPELTTKRKLFGDLEIRECVSCGHVYNSKFEPKKIRDMYASSVKTSPNTVSKEMSKSVIDLSVRLLSFCKNNPLVADIGGGSGDLSFKISENAERVFLFEPCLNLDLYHFKNTKVKLIQKFFLEAKVEIKFDLIIIKQVLEHEPNLRDFLLKVRTKLKSNGKLYIEVPSFDYIKKNLAFFDFIYEHVHYFKENLLQEFLCSIGFKILEYTLIKGGHDIGFLLEPTQPRLFRLKTFETSLDLKKNIDKLIYRSFKSLEKSYKSIGIYGATSTVQTFTTLYENYIDRVKFVFDDTPFLDSLNIYTSKRKIKIFNPTIKLLNKVDVIIIAAYLHDDMISKRLRNLGFQGKIYTLGNNIETSSLDNFIQKYY